MRVELLLLFTIITVAFTQDPQCVKEEEESNCCGVTGRKCGWCRWVEDGSKQDYTCVPDPPNARKKHPNLKLECVCNDTNSAPRTTTICLLTLFCTFWGALQMNYH
eukprot:TRINITY_DN76548_c0_g1_i1.p1 TRINITY_DN76548_c0_g1~~TRINITY_DN76548_c0_g1_i1.p1  ORF type:complete len:106 (-),score=17.80 TRINITY_DN76548_c0_g1_i1:244-561(-)